MPDWIPAVVVIVLAIIGPQLDNDDECAPSDGPQFKCWLEEQS